jgi:RNA polymerase sigma-54 factor
MDFNYNLNLEQKQQQKLIMTQDLQMAIKILQFNSLELKEFIEDEMNKNPLLELIEEKSRVESQNRSFNSTSSDRFEYEKFIAYEPHFYEYLENQLFEVLEDSEYQIGKFIIGSLNELGELTLDYQKIAEYFTELGEEITADTIRKIHKKIKKLDINHAIDLETRSSGYINPDFIVKKQDGNYEIFSNQEYYPGLKINSYYHNLMKKADDAETYEYLKEKYQSALWLIKSIEQRKETIKKIIRAIIKKQSDFFEKGLKYLYTMTMAEIAKEIEMHESTVSRATTGKFIQTPHGVFNLKFFFNSGIDKLSSVSIKAIICEEIEKEDKSSPLSDSSMALRIKENYQLDISRRTIAKYRKSLGIGGSRKRKA